MRLTAAMAPRKASRSCVRVRSAGRPFHMVGVATINVRRCANVDEWERVNFVWALRVDITWMVGVKYGARGMATVL